MDIELTVGLSSYADRISTITSISCNDHNLGVFEDRVLLLLYALHAEVAEGGLPLENALNRYKETAQRLPAAMGEGYEAFCSRLIHDASKPEWFDNAIRMYDSGSPTDTATCVKFIRDQTGWGLKEAKQYIDEHINGKY